MAQRRRERLDVSFLASVWGVILITKRDGHWGQVLTALCVWTRCVLLTGVSVCVKRSTHVSSRTAKPSRWRKQIAWKLLWLYQSPRRNVLQDLNFPPQVFTTSCLIWSLKFTLIMCEDPVRTAQYTHCVSVIKTSQLMLYREIIAVCSEIHTKHINALGGQNVELYIQIQSVPRSKHTPSGL